MTKAKTGAVAVVAAAAPNAIVYPTDEQLVARGFDNLSKRIRELSRLGAKTGEIAKIVRRSNGEHPKYQHVRNVLNTPLKKTEAPAPAPAAATTTEVATPAE